MATVIIYKFILTKNNAHDLPRELPKTRPPRPDISGHVVRRQRLVSSVKYANTIDETVNQLFYCSCPAVKTAY